MVSLFARIKLPDIFFFKKLSPPAVPRGVFSLKKLNFKFDLMLFKNDLIISYL